MSLSLIMTPALPYQGPTLLTLFHLNYFCRGPVSKHKRVGTSTYQSGGHFSPWQLSSWEVVELGFRPHLTKASAVPATLDKTQNTECSDIECHPQEDRTGASGGRVGSLGLKLVWPWDDAIGPHVSVHWNTCLPRSSQLQNYTIVKAA